MSQQRPALRTPEATSSLCSHCDHLESAIWKSSAAVDNAPMDRLNGTRSVKLGFSRYDMYPSFPSITRSAGEGCHFCSALIKLWRHLDTADAPSRSGCLTAECKRRRNDLDSDRIEENILYIRFQEMDSPAGSVNSGRSIGQTFNLDIRDPSVYEFTVSPDILSDRNVQFIRDALSECNEGSEWNSCQAATPFLPTRLLDVGDGNVPDSDVRLVLSKTLQNQSTAYVALSYCWGDTTKHAPLTTTAETLTDRMDRIALDELPATFRDAVIVTRVLGLRFIWIDSLCILQGDEQDWETEPAMMVVSMFRGAFLTIAATQAMHSREGFLASSQSRVIDLGRFSLSRTIAPHGHLQSYTDEFSSECLMLGSASAWASRAWTLQEFKLSRRILLFDDLLRFQCLCLSSNELTRHRIRHLAKHKVQPRRGFGDYDFDAEPYILWRNAVTQYSGRKIAVPTDKLPAISGLAHFFKSSSLQSDTYLAGIWKGDLINQLLWLYWMPRPDLDEISHPNSTSSGYIAPTWSWASSTKEICFSTYIRYLNNLRRSVDGIFVKQHVSIVEARTTLLGDDEMGRISAGHLRLRGPIKWYADSSDHRSIVSFWDRAKADNSPSTTRWGSQNYAILFRACFRPLEFRTDCGPKPHDMEGLILRRLPKRTDGREVFVRVGAFFIELQDEDVIGDFADPKSLCPSFFSDRPSEEVFII